MICLSYPHLHSIWFNKQNNKIKWLAFSLFSFCYYCCWLEHRETNTKDWFFTEFWCFFLRQNGFGPQKRSKKREKQKLKNSLMMMMMLKKIRISLDRTKTKNKKKRSIYYCCCLLICRSFLFSRITSKKKKDGVLFFPFIHSFIQRKQTFSVCNLMLFGCLFVVDDDDDEK